MNRTSKRSAVVAIAAAAAVLVGLPAVAYFTLTSNEDTAAVTANALGTPATSGLTISASSVSFTVAAPATGPAPTAYQVNRTAPAPAVPNVCSVPAAGGTCTDPSPVPGQTNTYAVFARLGTSWASLTPATVTAAVPSNTVTVSAPDLLAADDSGASNTDDITNDTTPRFTGTATAGATVNLYDGANPTAIGTQVLGAGVTSYSIQVSALTGGAHSITAVATVGANNSAPSSALAVTIDTTAPTASDIQTGTGTTAGKIDANDEVRFTFSEAVDPTSVSTGWTGTSVGVTVTFRNSNSSVASQRIQTIVVTTGGAAVNLVGQVGWNQSYMSGANNGTSTATGTMTLSADKKTVTIKLAGSPSGGNTTAITASSTLNWTPVAGPKDVAGNSLTSLTPVTEQGTADIDF
ncbi:MAG TPA: Ig-like domain-containing protein [Frankiaceae bacterium]|nr:Ig-like domain-containing protein [Frankiaceae bacterium]